MTAQRILLLHDNKRVVESVWRICHRHDAALHLVRSQTELLEMLCLLSSPSDLVIAKEVGDDWLSIAATLIACRAEGVRTPFLVVAEPSDLWMKHAVEAAGSAVLIDDRSSRWLVPLLLEDWLDGLTRAWRAPPRARSTPRPESRVEPARAVR